MPYIPKNDRAEYRELVQELARRVPDDRTLRPGHLNYVITSLLREAFGKEIRYADHNEIQGILSCVAAEYYRRSTVPYEDEKIKVEGDLDE